MMWKVILSSLVLLQPTNAQKPHSQDLEKMEADCIKKRQLEVVPALQPCGAVPTCSTFQGLCAAGEDKKPAGTMCEGNCTAAQCCAPKKCGLQPGLCVNEFTPKEEVGVSFEFAPEKTRACPREYAKIDNETMCHTAAKNLTQPYGGLVNTPRFPAGCFHCNREQCSSIMRGMSVLQYPTGAVFFNQNPPATSNQVSLLRHYGTKMLCRAEGRLCLQKGCDTETCCEPRTCGAEFTEGCQDGEEIVPKETKCKLCNTQECCKPRKCADNQDALCVDGWKPVSTKPIIAAPSCPSPAFKSSPKDTTTCPVGYEHITTVEECAKAAQNLTITPSDTNGDGVSVALSDTAGLEAFVRKRLIGPDDTLGAKKPYGCYSDSSIRIVGTEQKLITTIWLNMYNQSTRKHDNSAPLCKVICDAPAPAPPPVGVFCDPAGCTRETCCEPSTCETDFHGQCGRGEYVNKTIRCPAGGCTPQTCCQKQFCSAGFTCDAAAGWEPKSADTRCQSAGCDRTTCCVQPNCGLDFQRKDGQCAAGEDFVDPRTLCHRVRTDSQDGMCTADTCCKPKICANSLPCEGGLRPKRFGTLCEPTGCTTATCCAQATCGKDFMGGCGAWSAPVAPTTVCPSGQCDAGRCCSRTCNNTQTTLYSKTQCNEDHIEKVVAFDEQLFPNATFDEKAAIDACTSLGRANCFAVMDDGCDGKNLKMCVPKSKNDPFSVVLQPSTSGSCVCYEHAQQTCGYNFQGTCQAGQRVRFNQVCPAGEGCSDTVCCEPLQCKKDFHGCSAGFVLKDQQPCNAGGCDIQTCCEQLTCGMWQGECNPWDTPKSLNTTCSDGVCRRDVCCTRNCPHPNTMCNGTVKDFQPAIGRGRVGDAVAACKQLGRRECYAVLDVLGDGMDLKRCVDNGENERRNYLLVPSASSDVCFYVPAGATCGNSYHGTCHNAMKVSLDTACTPTELVSGRKLALTSEAPVSPAVPITPPAPKCTEDFCCANVTLNECHADAVTCAVGTKFKSARTVCPNTGCTPATCCEPLTCGSDFKEYCEDWDFRAPGDKLCGGLCTKEICCQKGTPTTTATGPCTTKEPAVTAVATTVAPTTPPVATTVAPTTPPVATTVAPTTPPRPACEVTYTLGDRNTNACPVGFTNIEYVHVCVEAIQFLRDVITPIPVDRDDTAAMTQYLNSRTTMANQDVKGSQQPFGCYVETVQFNGKPMEIPKINYHKNGSIPLPQAAPICQSNQEQYALSPKDTTTCTAGYEPITTVEECVKGAQFLKITPSDTNGDGKAVSLHNTTAMEAWLRTREIAPDAELGNKKPYGCYSDSSIRIVAGGQNLITTLWVNHNKAASGKHDNSAPLCKLICDIPQKPPVLAQKLFDVAEEGQHLRKRVASENSGRSFVIAGGVFVMLVTTFGFVSMKRYRTSSSMRSTSASLSLVASEESRRNPTSYHPLIQDTIMDERSIISEDEVFSDAAFRANDVGVFHANDLESAPQEWGEE